MSFLQEQNHFQKGDNTILTELSSPNVLLQVAVAKSKQKVSNSSLLANMEDLPSTPSPKNLSARQTKTNTCANSVDLDETAYHEPSHQDLDRFLFYINLILG